MSVYSDETNSNYRRQFEIAAKPNRLTVDEKAVESNLTPWGEATDILVSLIN